jgi:hypothetical protein
VSSTRGTSAPGSKPDLSGAAPTYLGPLLPQGGIRERLQRLVQGCELVGNPDEAFGRFEAAVERVHLVAQPVEPFENGIELAVIEGVTLRHYG